MNSQPERVHQGAAGALEPVGPSLIVKIVMRPMTKILNPLIVKLAGRRHFLMAAQIRHVGRRSGRTYTTPVSARRSGDSVLIALTFGNQSDWSRNVRSAGGACSAPWTGSASACSASSKSWSCGWSQPSTRRAR